MANILIVDDENTVREVLGNFLARQDHRVTQASSGEEAIALIRENIFDVAIVDIRMRGLSGLDVLAVIRELSPDTETIIMTGFGTIDIAVKAMKLGAYDFITKPLNFEELMLVLGRTLEKKEIVNGMKASFYMAGDLRRFTNIIGRTPAMSKVFTLIDRVCQSDSAVLIIGESGTGKELVARTIHDNSPRSGKPFVPINCAAIPEYLQESEFFGHVRGAFTDAIRNKKGLFESAHGGTIFLDEIADASLSTQLKLLRFLEDGEIRRVGENTTIHVDARLITATNKDISKAVKEKTFREDLYYRINVVEIYLPPLRERKDDIPLLAHHFMQKYSEHLKKGVRNISKSALLLLMEYEWPGNVRELQNAIQHAVALASGETILPENLPAYTRSGDSKTRDKIKTKSLPLRELKKAYVLQTLEECSWDCGEAAKILGVGKATIYRKLKEYGFAHKF